MSLKRNLRARGRLIPSIKYPTMSRLALDCNRQIERGKFKGA
jgi:hypothetical protein